MGKETESPLSKGGRGVVHGTTPSKTLSLPQSHFRRFKNSVAYLQPGRFLVGLIFLFTKVKLKEGIEYDDIS
jgi:hypothetical protein